MNTVIAGISNFWCSTFTIPKKCIKIIHSLCGAYLWKGSSEGYHSARVSWETVTLPKEGGLGIRNLVWWNKACSIKLLWLLFFRVGSIWVAWFTENVLSGDLSNLWTLREKQNHTSATRKIFRVRDYVYNWIKIVPGNGKKCRFWSDNWSPFGNLKKHFDLPLSTSHGIRASATLHDLYQQGRWLLPHPRSEAQLNLHIHLSTITLSDENDDFLWCSPPGSPLSNFSTRQVYNEIKPHQQRVPWRAVIWPSRGIPRHNFLTWLVTLNRCPTKDRMLNWGIQTDPTCVLCNGTAESRDHLFFECSCSWNLWSRLAGKANWTTSRNWDTGLGCLQSSSLPRYHRLLILLGWQASIYLLWSERNKHLHRQQFRPTSSLERQADSLIRNRISGFREENPRLSSSMLQLWFDR